MTDRRPSAAVRRCVLGATPVLVLVTTYAVFKTSAHMVGPVPGYLLGFLFYWSVWCLVVPLWLLGWARVRSLFQSPVGMRTPLARVALLGLPLILGYGYAFPRALAGADVVVILVSAVLALVNGVLEELLWRGAYIEVFPDSRRLSVYYPTIGFAVWHFSPQSVFPNPAPGGRVSLVIVAGLVGLIWAWVARRDGSIRATTLSHVLFDFSGLGGRLYLR
jgi:membrane protease YdiL (CAAX protease family)